MWLTAELRTGGASLILHIIDILSTFLSRNLGDMEPHYPFSLVLSR